MNSIARYLLSRKAFKRNIERSNAIINKKTSFYIKEAYNTARTNVMFSLIDEEGCKRIVVSSPSPGDGKTTSCMNLAITFAQTGAKILLIDGDLRKPKIHNYLNAENDLGLSNVLGKFCELKEVIRTSNEHGLDYILSGPIPPNPAELLGSKTMQELMSQVSAHYDYIFIDTPPINVVSDAITLSKYISGIVMVVRQDCTTHDLLQRSIANIEFADAKILGFILNDADAGNRKYKYGYRYRRKYSYGYGNGYNYYNYNYYNNIDSKEDAGSDKNTSK